MGRRKIKIQPLPESQIRAKFKKRKSGLVKKAYELGTLCGAQVALIIFSKDGEEVIDKGYNATTLEIIQRYWREVLCCKDEIRLPQQQIAASQVQQFQSNFDSSTEGIPMDPRMQQEVAMDANMQQDQFMNPQMQQDQYMNPQLQQDPYMNPQVQQDRHMNPHVQQAPYMNPQVQQDHYMNLQVQQDQFMNPQVHQQEVPMDPNMQQILYMNSQVQQQEVPMDPNMQQILYMNSQVQQQEVPTANPCMQQDQYINFLRQQEVPTDSCMQQNQYVNPHGQRSMTGISQMQQGMQYSMGTNFVDTSIYMQDVVEGNQHLHAQGHQTGFENQTNLRYNGQPSEPGYHN